MRKSRKKKKTNNSSCLRLGKHEAYMMAFSDTAQENPALHQVENEERLTHFEGRREEEKRAFEGSEEEIWAVKWKNAMWKETYP